MVHVCICRVSLRLQCANLMRFITLQVALLSNNGSFIVQACSSMHFVLSIDKHRLSKFQFQSVSYRGAVSRTAKVRAHVNLSFL